MILVSGLIAGLIHTISGPDHLAALAPIAAADHRRAVRLGALWGLGHGLGVCALGGIGVLAKQTLAVEWLSTWSEFLVGLVLIGVGVWAVRRSFDVTIHTHGHRHAEKTDHGHIHVHIGKKHGQRAHRNHQHTALGVGALHGAAGTGHLFGVVPALALGAVDAGIYLAAYLLAAVGSMALFGGIIGRVTARGGQLMLRRMMLASGGVAAAVGVVWSWSSWPLA